ncbi:MAG: Rne/Rng family ribonuclease [Thermoanaerobaculia bacterium]|nr:Rne/Rng family ribonuclease [Thermoanaerobaculia bacterium]
MTRRMLINAQSREELRIAVLSDSTLENYQVEVAEGGLTRGNIYRGVIANLQSSLNAAFIDYGVGKNGFLAIQDVVAEARYKEPPAGKRAQIDDLLIKGKPIVVQVVREPEGQKGAAITTNLSLAGRYLVLTPFDDTRGVSRKVEDDETRSSLKALVGKLELPEGCGVIVRTNALDQTRAELQRDLAALLRVWKRIQNEAAQGTSARLLYSDQDLILRALRDHLDTAVEEILVDDEAAHLRAHEYLQAFLPRTKTQLVRYTDRIPLFSKYGLESQIERIFNRVVPLPSGGSIVIDRTEALTAIDVNSGRSSSGGGHEDMALATNLEAAREVARQLRLRDLGGLVVVDFIDMRAAKNNRAVEKAVKEALKVDKARAAIGRISPNGLLEINRQRIQQALSVRAHRPCPTCSGTGRVPSIESLGLNLLRRIEARAATGRLMKARVELHPELADAIQNGRRAELARIETEYGVEIEIAASPRLLGPEEQIEWRDRPGGATFVPVRPLADASGPLTIEPAVLDIVPADDLVDGDGDESEEAAVSAAAVLGEAAAPEAGKRKRRRRGGRRRNKRHGGEATETGALRSDGEPSEAGQAAVESAVPAEQRRAEDPEPAPEPIPTLAPIGEAS